MFLDWKNQHCENDYTNQSNLQIQCYQAINDIFHRTRRNNPKIYIEPQYTPNCQSNLRQKTKTKTKTKTKNWRFQKSQTLDYTTKLQYSKQ